MTFTYQSYIDLIHLGMDTGVSFFLRHDVDISLKKALEMAEIESKNGFHSTYYILLSSPFYNALEAENLERIRMIRELGMGVGLHYDLSIKNDIDKTILAEIMVQMGLLEHHIGKISGMSVTFHKPVTGKDVSESTIQLLNQNEIYCPNFDSRFKYISDSGHNWREDPFDAVATFESLHINTHPEWYNEKELNMEECLYNLDLDGIMDKRVYKEIVDIRDYLERIKYNDNN